MVQWSEPCRVLRVCLATWERKGRGRGEEGRGEEGVRKGRRRSEEGERKEGEKKA